MSLQFNNIAVVESLNTQAGRDILKGWFKTVGRDDVNFVKSPNGVEFIQTIGYSSHDDEIYTKGEYHTNTISYNLSGDIVVNPFFTWEGKYIKRERDRMYDYIMNNNSDEYRSGYESDMFEVRPAWGKSSNYNNDPLKMWSQDRVVVYTKKEDIANKLKDFLLEIPSIIRNSKIDSVLNDGIRN